MSICYCPLCMAVEEEEPVETSETKAITRRTTIEEFDVKLPDVAPILATITHRDDGEVIVRAKHAHNGADLFVNAPLSVLRELVALAEVRARELVREGS